MKGGYQIKIIDVTCRVNIAQYTWSNFHTVRVILNDKLQCESHKLYGPPTAVTWLQLPRQQTNTGTSADLTAERHWSTRTRLRSLFRFRDVTPGSLTGAKPERGDFMESLRRYILLTLSFHLARYVLIHNYNSHMPQGLTSKVNPPPPLPCDFPWKDLALYIPSRCVESVWVRFKPSVSFVMTSPCQQSLTICQSWFLSARCQNLTKYAQDLTSSQRLRWRCTPYGLVNIYPDEGSVILPNSLALYQSTRGYLPINLHLLPRFCASCCVALQKCFTITAWMSSERRIIYVSYQQKL